jgi:hypothetical protein
MSSQFVPIHGSSGEGRHDHDGAVRGESRPEVPEKKPASTRCRGCVVSRANLPPPVNAPQLVISPPAPPDLKLTRDEKSILDAFRTMDDRRKREALDRMDRIAHTHPGRAGPRLRLVGGGAE